MRGLLAALATILLSGATAHAQAPEASPASAEIPAPAERACEEGRVRVSGRCCWPGQSWSDERGLCTGAPTCPEALVEHGDTCDVRLVPLEPDLAVAPPPAAAAVPPGYPSAPGGYGGSRWSEQSTDRWPSVRGHEDAPTVRAISGRGEDEGLVFTSIAIIQAGWMMGLVGTLMTEATGCNDFSPFGGSRRSCDAWAWGFLPLAGGMIGGMVGISRGNGWGFGFGIPSVIHQGIGLIMLAISLANETTEIVDQPLEGATGLSARLVPGAAGADAGLSLDVSF